MYKSEKAKKWGLRVHIFWYIVANVAQILVWWFATPELFFWPLWSILGWGIGLAAHIWADHSGSRSVVQR